MKAITEERLRRFRETCDPRDRYALDTLIKECQELDTLTKSDNKTALEKFREAEIECDDLINQTPIERLRYFVSLMCDINQDSQSWLDIEFLFDECINNPGKK